MQEYKESIKFIDTKPNLCKNVLTLLLKPLLNLDERYHSYLDGSKKMRIDGNDEKVIAYGWHCDGSDITGHYVTTENYKLYYNMEGSFKRMETLAKVAQG